MARLPRISVPGHPYHVVQRGNNRQAIFASDLDRQVMLELLGESASRFGVALHAYVLIDNHFHLLATPDSAQSLSRMMQAVGRRYVRHFNDCNGRTGTLWDGRYRSALLQSERFLLACMVFLDLHPVRSGLVTQPQDYPWSSYAHYTGARTDRLVTRHALIWALGNTPFARESAYRDLVQAGNGARLDDALTRSASGGWPLGDAAFVSLLQRQTERRLSRGSPGRPAASAVVAGKSGDADAAHTARSSAPRRVSDPV